MTTIQEEKLAVSQELDAILGRLRELSIRILSLEAQELGCSVEEVVKRRGSAILAIADVIDRAEQQSREDHGI